MALRNFSYQVASSETKRLTLIPVLVWFLISSLSKEVISRFESLDKAGLEDKFV